MPDTLIDLTGRVAVVTGASSGIGAGTAVALAAAGARVVATGRDASRLASTAETISRAGGACRQVVADLLEPEAAGRIVHTALQTFGRIDHVVHAAGSFLMRPVENTPGEELDHQLRLHINAPFELTKAVFPHLRPGSSIVFLSSNLAHVGAPHTSAYAASKGGVEALARTLAVELGARGIRVNTVAPGVTRTPMTAELTTNPVAEAEAVKSTPLGRLGTVADVAAAIVYLCSDVAGYVAGASLRIDGGSSAA